MKLNPRLTIAIALLVAAVNSPAQVLISGYLANPASTDSPYEYVQLVAAQNLDFSLNPMSVVFANNGTGTANGWVEGGNITYKFNLTSGTVSAGSVFYVGGSGKLINGSGSADISGQNWIRTINTGTTAGDDFGNFQSAGVLGNGGANADGIGIFNTTTLTASTVPLDAVFFGSGTGTAVVGGGTQGYQLPVNDLYGGGKLQSASPLFLDPASGTYTRLTGAYDPQSGLWTVARTAAVVASPTTITDITPQITVVPEPASFALAGLVAAGFLSFRRRK